MVYCPLPHSKVILVLGYGRHREQRPRVVARINSVDFASARKSVPCADIRRDRGRPTAATVARFPIASAAVRL